MSTRLLHYAIAAALCAAGVAASPAAEPAAQGRRVVDEVQSGNAKSERDHEASGEGITEGSAAGRAYRRASGWLRYTMRTFDDTEVTVACLCRGTEGRRVIFELLVDDQPAGIHAVESPSAEPVLKEWRVPERLTTGKAKITVTLRGIAGATPGIIELRTVQEHLE